MKDIKDWTKEDFDKAKKIQAEKVESLLNAIKSKVINDQGFKYWSSEEYGKELQKEVKKQSFKNFEFDYDLYRQRLNEEIEQAREFALEEQEEQEPQAEPESQSNTSFSTDEDDKDPDGSSSDGGGDSDDGYIFSVPKQYGSSMKGSEIYGLAESHLVGFSVSLNTAGNIVAIGAPDASFDGLTNVGYVMVFAWDGTTWNPRPTIEGSSSNERFGYSVAIDGIGERILIGAPGYSNRDGMAFAYDWNGTSWTLLGYAENNILPSGGQFGCSVDISKDGDTCVIGEYETSQAHAYDLSEGGFEEIGAPMIGLEPTDWFGYDVSINNDGTVVAIGAPGVNVGYVSIYQKIPNEDSYSPYTWNWVQLGLEILGQVDDNSFGHDTQLNGDGTIIAISDANSSFVYKFSNSSWSQLGNTITEPTETTHITINSEGNRIAASNIFGNNSAGYVKIYDYNQSLNTWSQVVYDIVGEPHSWLGYSVDFNDTGNFIAIGSIFADSENGIDSGSVRIYGISN